MPSKTPLIKKATYKAAQALAIALYKFCYKRGITLVIILEQKKTVETFGAGAAVEYEGRIDELTEVFCEEL